MSNILSIKNLKIYYRVLRGDVRAADDISFDVKRGEIVGIAGESGSGKSTLCNSLILIKPPMKYISGSVKLNNEELPLDDYEKMREFRYKEISIVPQYALDALNPTRKIGALIEDLVESHGVDYSKLHDKLLKRLNLVSLPESILSMYPIELSGGMKQRTVMVLSTLLNPSLLIADEITSALDVSTQKAVVELTKEFRDRGFIDGVLFITHDISVLYQLADSIIIMYAGKVVERASAKTILKKPLHPYTELLISSLPEIGVRFDKKPLKGIKGKPPSLFSPPKGCRFKDRCPKATDKCLEEPALKEIAKDHFVACWKRS